MSDVSDASGDFDRPDGIVAAEYVLHLLDPAERRAFEERLEISGSLRIEVARWAEDLVRLADGIADVAPPARIRENLRRFVSSEAGPASSAQQKGRRFSFGRFLSGALGGMALAAAAVVLLFVAVPEVDAPYSGPLYTADVAAEDASLLIQARFNPRDSALTLQRQQGGPRPDRVLELWLIDEGADAPVSLGVLPDEPEATIELSPNLAARITAGTLAVSDEPPGGSTTGSPTGDVLAVGEVTEL